MPPASLGEDGDFFIDMVGDLLYGPKEAGAWPTPGVNLVGGLPTWLQWPSPLRAPPAF
jgi:hypothetical protein